MTHSRAVALMILVSMMWASAGPVSRHIEHADGLELTFWRSTFAAVTVALWLLFSRGTSGLTSMVRAKPAVWISGLMWAVMFTCFMVALSLTHVANVLVVQCLAPVLTALLAAAVLRHRIGWRTWVAIGVAAASVFSMYIFDIAELDGPHTAGMMLALGIPLAAAINWVVLKRHGGGLEMEAAVLIGGVISAVLSLAWALPFQASTRDLLLLAALGVFQLSLPCILAMHVLKHLKAPEAALLSMLEIVFGIGFTWLFGGESPSTAALVGGTALLLTLAWHEAAPRQTVPPGVSR